VLVRQLEGVRRVRGGVVEGGRVGFGPASCQRILHEGEACVGRSPVNPGPKLSTMDTPSQQTNLDASHSDLGAFDIVALRVLLCWEARAVKKELTPSSLCLSGGATPTKRRPNPG
jgi:hypothetical protein